MTELPGGSEGKAPSSEELSQVRRHRQEKLEAIRERGLEPYAYTYDRTHLALEAVSLFKEAERAGALDENEKGGRVSVAGRITSYRAHGKSAFAHIEDRSGQIQIYFKKNVLGDEPFEGYGWDPLLQKPAHRFIPVPTQLLESGKFVPPRTSRRFAGEDR